MTGLHWRSIVRLFHKAHVNAHESRRRRAERALERRRREKDQGERERALAERIADIERLILTHDPHPRH